jgi:hypothetical protein
VALVVEEQAQAEGQVNDDDEDDDETISCNLPGSGIHTAKC